MLLEGALAIRVGWDGGRVHEAAIASTRPVGVARALVDRPAAEAVATVPLLFAVCGRSQAVAAALACERASGLDAATGATRARAELVTAEIVHEYLWRMLLDWPRAVGEPADADLLGEARRLIAEAAAASGWALAFAPAAMPEATSRWTEAREGLRQLVADRVLAATPSDWSEPRTGRARFDEWIAGARSPSARLLGRLARAASAFAPRRVALMPRVTPGALIAHIVPRLDAEPRFAAEPDWQGECRETGALARQQAHPLIGALGHAASGAVLPRLTARLVELGALLDDGDDAARFGSVALGPGDAIAWVETARGLLLHRVSLTGGAVDRYQIIAPTEWNFHPRGPLAAELRGITAPDGDRLRERIDLLIQSLDPCVAYDVRIERRA